MPRKAASRTNKKRSISWPLVLVLLSTLWLGVMVAASILSYEHRLPVRIDNWKPAPTR